MTITPADQIIQPGDSVNISVTVYAPGSVPVYYKFYYCANYGTLLYDSTPWTVVQDYSLNNSGSYTFPEASGRYGATLKTQKGFFRHGCLKKPLLS